MESRRKDGQGVITSHKTILSGSPDDLRRKVETLAPGQEPHVYQAGTRLRELAVTLAMQAGLRVSMISYEDGSQELEVVLTDHPSCDPIVIGRDQHGGRCQLSWDLWLPIEDQPGIETVVNLIQAALNAPLPVLARNTNAPTGRY
jgi:hypothetical protein